MNGAALFFTDRDAGQRGGGRLTAITIGKEKEPELTVVSEGVSSYEMSLDGKKLLLRQGSNLYVVDAKAGRISNLNDSRVDLSGWAFPLNVREDWRQIFIDAWRLERDYFYDPGMHGTDWEGIRDKYLPLVDRVTTRDELSDVIGRVWVSSAPSTPASAEETPEAETTTFGWLRWGHAWSVIRRPADTASTTSTATTRTIPMRRPPWPTLFWESGRET